MSKEKKKQVRGVGGEGRTKEEAGEEEARVRRRRRGKNKRGI
jgi:hypothetical protein